MTQGKGDKRRPMVIDDRQLEINWAMAYPESKEPKQTNNQTNEQERNQ